jgi:hypothetical protein
MSEPRPVPILAVDGGGIRGIVPATVLVELQGRLPRPIVDYGNFTNPIDGAAARRWGLGRMDAASQENVAGLEQAAREHCRQHAAQLDAIAAELAA